MGGNHPRGAAGFPPVGMSKGQLRPAYDRAGPEGRGRRVLAVVAALATLAVAGATAFVLARPYVSGGYGRDAVAWLTPDPRADRNPTPSPTPSPTASPTPTGPRLVAPTDPRKITANASLFGWAFLDRETGKITGSSNREKVTNTVESMIKPWITADYLRRLDEHGKEPTPAELDEMYLMIVDSNDPMAAKYYVLGGELDVIRRLQQICDLDHVRIDSQGWSYTGMTPADAARMGACLADGRAAGAKWTPWLMDAMRSVRGGINDGDGRWVQGGRWGIIEGLPPELASQTGIKNGWTSWVDGWHVSCLAVHPDWTLVIMVHTTLSNARKICRDVAKQLVVD